MTDQEHLYALRADVGTIMAAVAVLLLDTTNVRAMVDGGKMRQQAENLYNRSQQIVGEIEQSIK